MTSTRPEYLRRHTCVFVRDVDAAMRVLSNVGLEFGRPADVSFHIRAADGREFEQTLRVVFSRDGSTELLQPVTPGPLTDGVEPGTHHIGVRTSDLERAIADLTAAGAEVEWRLYYKEVPVAAFFRPSSLMPARLELVNVAASQTVPLDR